MPTVREFARLTTDAVPQSLDQVTITQPAFNWLVQHARGGPSSLGLVSMDGPRSLRVLNFVGVLETPCGTRIEILPKYAVGEEEIGEARTLLVCMVAEALRLDLEPGQMSQISTFKLPLPEWLAYIFLEEIQVSSSVDFARVIGRWKRRSRSCEAHWMFRGNSVWPRRSALTGCPPRHLPVQSAGEPPNPLSP